METTRNRNGGGRGAGFAVTGLVPLTLLLVATIPASADPSLVRSQAALECHVRSELAEADGDRPHAIAWAESLAALDPASSLAMSRVAELYEDSGENLAALDCADRALYLDSLNSDAAMLVGRLRVLAGEPGLAAEALTPPLRQPGAKPELYALRALAHELDRDYAAALADLEKTGPLLHDFRWIATGVLEMALEDGRLEDAYSAFRLAIRINPGDARTLTLGLTLAHQIEDPILERILLRVLSIGAASHTPGPQADDEAGLPNSLTHSGWRR